MKIGGSTVEDLYLNFTFPGRSNWNLKIVAEMEREKERKKNHENKEKENAKDEENMEILEEESENSAKMVTLENLHEYVMLVTDAFLRSGIQAQLEALCILETEKADPSAQYQ